MLCVDRNTFTSFPPPPQTGYLKITSFKFQPAGAKIMFKCSTQVNFFEKGKLSDRGFLLNYQALNSRGRLFKRTLDNVYESYRLNRV